MNGIDLLLKDLSDFEQTSEGVAYDLRLDFADIVLKKIIEKGWTHEELAKRTGYSVDWMHRMAHSDCNLTIKQIGEICHAIGIKITFVVA